MVVGGPVSVLVNDEPRRCSCLGSSGVVVASTGGVFVCVSLYVCLWLLVVARAWVWLLLWSHSQCANGVGFPRRVGYSLRGCEPGLWLDGVVGSSRVFCWPFSIGA